ncbi:MAG: hypothetical protein OXC31_19580 [Spirochaetaceae bacterium]|nr:hypothetical protein [Spirochaetaceae bacterium]
MAAGRRIHVGPGDRLAEGMTAEQLAETKLAADTFPATYRDS